MLGIEGKDTNPLLKPFPELDPGVIQYLSSEDNNSYSESLTVGTQLIKLITEEQAELQIAQDRVRALEQKLQKGSELTDQEKHEIWKERDRIQALEGKISVQLSELKKLRAKHSKHIEELKKSQPLKVDFMQSLKAALAISYTLKAGDHLTNAVIVTIEHAIAVLEGNAQYAAICPVLKQIVDESRHAGITIATLGEAIALLQTFLREDQSAQLTQNAIQWEQLQRVSPIVYTPAQRWQPFFTHNVTEKLRHEPLISIKTDIAPREFSTILPLVLDRLRSKIVPEQQAVPPAGHTLFDNVHLVETPPGTEGHQGLKLTGGTPDHAIMELSHQPATSTESGKIDILLKDNRLDKDEALMLMVLSAKAVLEQLGKTEFHIENCETQPELALKLFLLGKSMGLDPVLNETTSNAIQTSQTKLTSNGVEKSLGEIYTEVQKIDTKALEGAPQMIKNYIADLSQKSPEQGPPSTHRHQ